MRSSRKEVNTPASNSSPSSSSSSAPPQHAPKDLSSATSSIHDSTITVVVDESVLGKAPPVVTTPVSPPPSPPGQPANGSLKPAPPASATTAAPPAPSSRSATPRPVELAREPSPMPSNNSIPRGGSTLASLLHKENIDSERPLGTPPSPDSLPQAGHSRNTSTADSNAMSTARESPLKEEDAQGSMSVDPPQHHHPVLPHQSQPSPSPSSVAQPPYPHHSHVAAQRHRSQNHAPSKFQSDRTPLPHPQPHSATAHSIPTLPSHNPPPPPTRVPASASASSAPHPGSEDERDKYIVGLTRDREDLLRAYELQDSQINELEAQLKHSRGSMEKLKAERSQMLSAFRDWLSHGERLLAQFSDPSVYNGHAPPSISASRHSVPGGASLSSGMGGTASLNREYEKGLDRERTLSVASPYSPVQHGRSNSSYSHSADHQRYSSQSATPTSARPSNSNRPSNLSANYTSLRRSRRPSLDDLTAQPGGKRIKTDSGEYSRVSLETSAHGREPQDSRISNHVPAALPSTPIDPRRGYAPSVGPPPPFGRDVAATSGMVSAEKRGAGSLGNGTERGRDSPSDRRMAAIHGRDEDEEFPSPRRPYVTPTTTTGPSFAGNGHVAGMRPLPGHEARTSLVAPGDEADADGSPDVEVGAHQKLMELAEEDDSEARARTMRHPSARNGSRSSLASQDVDEMLAEAAGDGDDGRYATDVSMKSMSRQRHRAGSTNLSRNPGGVISSFHAHIGAPSDMNPSQARAYTHASQAGASKHGPMSTQSANSRGYVFRNTDVSEMEAQSQARSPEQSFHRSSFSGSAPSANPELGPSAPPVTTQFLPPQVGPPQPKKIYHHKGTGQVIGSQHAGLAPSLSGPMDPNSASTVPSSASMMTIDGQRKRTCKQCGQPGRYKDNKCVEKWGPGPQGPGTVCDRCRKKMKRVEKRATQDSAMMATASAAHHHQYPIAPAPVGSFTQLSSQGSQRFDESQESGYSQPPMTTDDINRSSLSRAGSQNYPPQHQPQYGRRVSYAPDSAARNETSVSYPPNRSSLEAMPPPSSFSNSRLSPTAGRGDAGPPSATEAAAGGRDADADADGDAEMDELMDEDLGAAADASTASGRHNHVKPETP